MSLTRCDTGDFRLKQDSDYSAALSLLLLLIEPQGERQFDGNRTQQYQKSCRPITRRFTVRKSLTEQLVKARATKAKKEARRRK